ncbi:MAG: alkaline phosphatase family protein [Chloroflexi bacterium]|nr:alkaline phosphatase family protein [Chloroflexota bacterium]
MTRIVVVGLDGATFDLIEPWAREGKLPNLARLLTESSHARLNSVIHPFSAQAWSSMVTGANAGKHRIFDFWERNFDVYGFRLTNASFRALPALWTLLSKAGRRVLVVNVPMSYPPEPVNGILISGWDTPGLQSSFTYPPELKAELDRLAGQPYVIVPDDWKYSTAQRGDLVLAELLREVDVRYAVVQKLMTQEPWDLCFFVVSALDGGSHFLWQYHDPTHPLYDAAETARYFDADPLLQVYQRTDQRLGELLATLPPDVHVLVVSDHGEGPLGDVAIHLNSWLAERGLLAFRAPHSQWSPLQTGRRWMARLVDWGKHQLYGRISFGMLSRLRHLWPERLRTLFSEELFYPNMDWSRTLAYSEELRGNIWINLRGRDPHGIVEPGAEYEAVRDRIIAELAQLTDPVTGRRLVNRVWRREERFSGPYVERIPDLLVEAEYPDIFRPRGKYRGVEPVRHLTLAEMRHRVSGCHRPEGIFIARGAGIRAGAALPPAEITDVAPTVLYLLGEPIPEWMDGRVLTEMLEPEMLAAQPHRRDPKRQEATSASEMDYDAEEIDILSDRLKGLGYL